MLRTSLVAYTVDMSSKLGLKQSSISSVTEVKAIVAFCHCYDVWLSKLLVLRNKRREKKKSDVFFNLNTISLNRTLSKEAYCTINGMNFFSLNIINKRSGF